MPSRTLSTGLLHMDGESKDDGRTIEWNAWYDDETGKRAEFKVKTAIADDDHFTHTMFGGKLADGSPGPTMTASYSRKK